MQNHNLKNIPRTLFVFKNDDVMVSGPGLKLLHGKWFEIKGWPILEPDFIEKYPRGYVDDQGIYIYQGKSASMPDIAIDKLKDLIFKLTKMIDVNHNLHIYLGSTDKFNNNKKEPQKDLGLIKHFLKN